MGDRGQVLINGVYLYTHWGATELIEIVEQALRKGQGRWDDEEYLARVIFQEMIGDDKGVTGYGLSTRKHGDIWRLITLKDRTVIVDDNDKIRFNGCFEDFLKWRQIK